jgi:hypothetical protein
MVLVLLRCMKRLMAKRDIRYPLCMPLPPYIMLFWTRSNLTVVNRRLHSEPGCECNHDVSPIEGSAYPVRPNKFLFADHPGVIAQRLASKCRVRPVIRVLPSERCSIPWGATLTVELHHHSGGKRERPDSQVNPSQLRLQFRSRSHPRIGSCSGGRICTCFRLNRALSANPQTRGRRDGAGVAGRTVSARQAPSCAENH